MNNGFHPCPDCGVPTIFKVCNGCAAERSEGSRVSIMDLLDEVDRLRRAVGAVPEDKPETLAVLRDVAAERRRQHAKWGQQDLPDASPATIGLISRSAEWMRDLAKNALWFDANPDVRRSNFGSDDQHFAWPLVLLEEVFEAYEEAEREPVDAAKLRAELVQVAAVAVQWIEAIDRRKEPGRG